MLRLRPFQPKDQEALIRWFQDERGFMMWSAGKLTFPLTQEKLEEFRKKQEETGDSFRFAALDETGKTVGHFLMRNLDYQAGSVHMGFIVVDPSIRGKGYGREMVSLAASYGFDILKMRRITLSVFDCNEKAHRCYKSAGFRDEAYEEGVLTWNGETWNGWHMAFEKENRS
ncbi:MAG: GNAT family N-acetyltransferase [Lachnospiraceae bacterium]